MKNTSLFVNCILCFEGTSYKIQLVCQFLYFFLFYLASEFISADTIFNIYWKKIFIRNFRFLTDSPKPTTLILSVTKVFCWCSLNLENFWFYIWVVVLWLNFTTQMTLHHLLLMRPWIEYLSAKTTKYILKFLERYVKRKSDISFRVIKNSSFDQRFLMVKTFLKILCQRLWWRLLVPHSEHFLVSSATLLRLKQNILILSMLV